MRGEPIADIAIVGAGAAGLATALVAKRARPDQSLLLLDGASKPGAKILVSGGGRCNVTNRVVSERDYWGGRPSVVRRILRAFPVEDTIDWFRDLGITLNEEAGGKLFPSSGRARDVLDALLRGADAAGVQLLGGHRVHAVEPSAEGFRIETAAGVRFSRQLVLATGGQSLPKSGSDGGGYELARRLGHTVVATTPALVPLVLDPADRFAIHHALSGVSHDVEIAVWMDGRVATRIGGALLWTHFGISGPVAMNASRHWLRAGIEGREVRLTANLCPGATYDDLERWWARTTAARPKASVVTVLSARLPEHVADAVIRRLRIEPARQLAHFTREERRALTRALIDWPLPVTACRGWNYAEATAGGVALEEIDPATMASRLCPGLSLVGEILDVDGRIGGFNFQWAWSSSAVAGRALSRRP